MPPKPLSPTAVEDACRMEIVQLHRFFERWFGGTAPRTDEAITRLSEALSPGFEMVTPAGQIQGREDLLRRIAGAHGGQPGVVIRVDDVRLRAFAAGLCVMSYRENQVRAGRMSARLATAVFRVLPGAAGAAPTAQWLHLQETSVQGG